MSQLYTLPERSVSKKISFVYLLFCLYLAIIRNIICFFMEHTSFDLSSAHVPKQEVAITGDKLDRLVLSPKQMFFLRGSGLATYDETGKLVALSPNAGDPNCFANKGNGMLNSEIVNLARSLRDQLGLPSGEYEI